MSIKIQCQHISFNYLFISYVKLSYNFVRPNKLERFIPKF